MPERPLSDARDFHDRGWRTGRGHVRRRALYGAPRVGEGGQKIVYLVHDNALGRECALSLLKMDVVDLAEMSRLSREAQTIARLGAQRHVVTVFDIGEEHGRPFVVSEYVPGGDLRGELRAAGGPLSLERYLSVAALMAFAPSGEINLETRQTHLFDAGDGTEWFGPLRCGWKPCTTTRSESKKEASPRPGSRILCQSVQHGRPPRSSRGFRRAMHCCLLRGEAAACRYVRYCDPRYRRAAMLRSTRDKFAHLAGGPTSYPDSGQSVRALGGYPPLPVSGSVMVPPVFGPTMAPPPPTAGPSALSVHSVRHTK